MVKEAQPVCIHSSFSNRVEIVGKTRSGYLHKRSLETAKRKKGGNKNPEILFFLFETTAIFEILGL